MTDNIVIKGKTILEMILMFIWGVSLTPLSIKLAGRFGLMDLPDPRKIHNEPIPRGAGLILWVGYLFWCLMFAPAGWYFPALATGGSMVFLVGYMDDMSSLNPMIRLSVHLLAAGLMVLPFQQGSPFFILISVLWIAGCTNAYNLIDGMNGLSLSMAIVTMVSLAWNGAATFTLPVVGLSSGVLFWNFPRARTFLGDGGVYLLGFVVANLILRWGAKMLSEAGPSLIPVMVLLGGVPVLDTLVTILRRLISRRSPFSPDRGHIHHRLLDMGLPVSVILMILSSLQMILFRLGALLLSQ